MAKVPAYCNNCGGQFYTESFISGSGATNIRLSGNRVQCPNCGGWANIVDGVFDLHDDVLLLKDGPPITRAMMTRLQEVIESAKSKALKTEELLSEVAGVSPELAEKLRKGGLAYAVIVLVLIWLIKSVSLNITVDVNRLIDQASGAAHSGDPEQIFETPLPNQQEVPIDHAHSIVAMTQIGEMSRQVRRQLERQAKKRSRGAGELA